jgi:predicted GNAT family N-acyltransferase
LEIAGAAMIRLAPLELDDAEHAAAALVPAFVDDPTMRWCFADDAVGYEERLGGYLRAGHRWHRGLGHPVEGAFADDTLVGACYVANPAVTARPDDVHALEAALVDACGEAAAERLAAYNRAVDEATPEGRHHTLAIVGVHPDQQGRGAGRSLVRWACALSDADPDSGGLVLDTGNEANLRFYARFGFQPLARVPLGDGVEHILLRPRHAHGADR